MAADDHLDAEPESDERAQLYDILLRTGLNGRDTYLLIQLIEEMASANPIHRFDAELDVQKAEIDALLDARRAELRFIQWDIQIIILSLTLALGITVGILIAQAS